MPTELAKAVTQLQIKCELLHLYFQSGRRNRGAEGDQGAVDRMREEFRRRRDVIVDGLNQINGFQVPQAQGRVLCFPNIEGTGMKSREAQTIFS